MIPLRVPFHQTIQCITSQESNESRNMCIAATDSTEAPAVLIKPTDSTTKKAVCRRSLLVSAGASLAIQICGHMLFPYPSLSLPSLNETPAKFVELPHSGGVKFLDLRLGSGSTPVDGDQVSIHYYGRLAAKQGWRFDSTYDHKDSSGEPLPFVFILGSGKVISGIESAVRSIKVGGIRRVIIPPSQGYQSTTQEPLPPNATTIHHDFQSNASWQWRGIYIRNTYIRYRAC